MSATLTLKNHLDNFKGNSNLKEYFKMMENLEKTTSKSINFCLRNLNTVGFHNKNKTSTIYCMVWSLEQIYDNFKNIGKHYRKKRIVFENKEKEIFRSVTEYFSLFFNELYSFNTRTFDKFYDYKDELKESFKKFEVHEKNFLLISELKSIFDKIYHMGIFISNSSNSFMKKKVS